jgi:hypothetical protein
MPMPIAPITITTPNVPDLAIEILLESLRRHGAIVSRPHVGYGEIESVAGVMRFYHSLAKVLTVEVVECKGHFPRTLLVGGIKQHIEEAVEMAKSARGVA